jgi:predicted amidophosphoribosyltransferase
MGSLSIWYWLIVGVIVLIVASFLIQMIRPSRLKRCPFCAELVRREAVVCKHCGREMDDREV